MIDPDALEACLEVLNEVSCLPPDDPRYLRVERAIGRLAKTAKQKRRAARRFAARREDRATVDACAAARDALTRAGAVAGTGGRADAALNRQRRCTVCKRTYRTLDPHYPHHCRECGEFDAGKRVQRTDLTGRFALVTGGRVKIGYALALRLLRDGAHVTVTTRFPEDARARYREEHDYASWRDRLDVVPLHLLHLPGLLAFCAACEKRLPHLDILVNNAAQTVTRPPAYYAEWARIERTGSVGLALTQDGRALRAFYDACLEPHGQDALFPPGRRDEEGLPLDLRRSNSWTMEAPDVPPIEAVEVQVVNALAPFLLTSRLEALLRKSPFPDRYVVHATAVEGQFVVRHKTPRHPHTNMAKAALNMFTRTSASAFARRGIYMVSVDTGWVTNENPETSRTRLRNSGFRAPLDVHDAAARIYDPIVSGMNGRPVYGVLLKDYVEVPW